MNLLFKFCTKCQKEKSFLDFSKDNSRKDGYFIHCKECQNHDKRKRRQKSRWKRTLESIKQRCNNPNNQKYYRYGGRGIQCDITEDELFVLWQLDKAYDMKCPTIDRIDNNGNYTFQNCRYIEASFNSSKDKQIIIYQLDLKGNFIKEWNSITIASKQLNITRQNINKVLLNKRKSAGGYKWRYANGKDS